MEEFSATIESAKKKKSLPEAAFNDLHARFRALDDAGAVWTVGIHTRRWHRLDESGGQKRWVADLPPERLNIKADTLTSLQALAAAPGVARRPAPAAPPKPRKSPPPPPPPQKPTQKSAQKPGKPTTLPE
jgi:hypothetical protein